MKENVKFTESTHKYTGELSGDDYISVTTLTKKYKLSADYENIPVDILQKAAERGTNTHAAFENYIKSNGQIIEAVNGYGLTEVNQLHTILSNRNIDLSTALSEKLVFDNAYKVAGTVDFIYYDGDQKCIADFKTTSSIHYDAVTWQLSIYNYLVHKDDIIQYYSTKLYVYQFYQGKVNVRELPCIDYEEVEKLFIANLTDADYVYLPDNTHIISDGKAEVLTGILEELYQYEQRVKELKHKKEELLIPLLSKMQTSKQYEITVGSKTNPVVIKLQNESIRSTPDMVKIKQFIEDKGESYEHFVKESHISASVNAKIKRR